MDTLIVVLKSVLRNGRYVAPVIPGEAFFCASIQVSAEPPSPKMITRQIAPSFIGVPPTFQASGSPVPSVPPFGFGMKVMGIYAGRVDAISALGPIDVLSAIT